MTSSELKNNVMPSKQKVVFDYLAQQERQGMLKELSKPFRIISIAYNRFI